MTKSSPQHLTDDKRLKKKQQHFRLPFHRDRVSVTFVCFADRSGLCCSNREIDWNLRSFLVRLSIGAIHLGQFISQLQVLIQIFVFESRRSACVMKIPPRSVSNSCCFLNVILAWKIFCNIREIVHCYLSDHFVLPILLVF